MALKPAKSWGAEHHGEVAVAAAAGQWHVVQFLADLAVDKHGTKWLAELTTGVHYYAMLCGVVNAFEVAASPDGDKLPA